MGLDLLNTRDILSFAVIFANLLVRETQPCAFECCLGPLGEAWKTRVPISLCRSHDPSCGGISAHRSALRRRYATLSRHVAFHGLRQGRVRCQRSFARRSGKQRTPVCGIRQCALEIRRPCGGHTNRSRELGFGLNLAGIDHARSKPVAIQGSPKIII